MIVNDVFDKVIIIPNRDQAPFDKTKSEKERDKMPKKTKAFWTC